MSIYNLESVRVLFSAMQIDTTDENILPLLRAGEQALQCCTESEALRLLSFAWDCAGIAQPAATLHASIMLETLVEESKKNA